MAANETPVPNGDTNASMYSSTLNQLRPNNIAKSANGDVKFNPFQPAVASKWVGTAVIHVDCNKPYKMPEINKAMVITICREPDYCGNIGGIAGSNYNLQNLDNYFFDGQLGTNLLF